MSSAPAGPTDAAGTVTRPAQQIFSELCERLQSRIIGQQVLVNRLLIALLADGHLLVEGAPGLAKTTAIKALAAEIEGDYHRIQFTPDLLPADLTGTEIYRPQSASFEFRPGPIFHNVLLADEINRAPAKVQSALLEAMAERQVTVGRITYPLPRLFLVMATQNPIEQEGTFPLPEAQLDRFLLYVRIGYPSAEGERRILALARQQALAADVAAGPGGPLLTQAMIDQARREVLALYLAPELEEYIVQFVLATRDPGAYDLRLARWLGFGASPRGTIALERCARAHAWLAGRDYVAPEDVQTLIPDTLRHRLLPSFDAEAEGIDSDRLLTELLARVPLP